MLAALALMNEDDMNNPEQTPDPAANPALETEAQAEPAAETGAGDALLSRIAVLEGELARSKDQMLRALADAENTRKRAIKEREDASRYAISAFARDMLEIADNFRRAIDALPEDARIGDERIASLISGIEATERVLLKNFEKHGIKKIEPLGQPFDPNFHEVMFEAPVPGKTAGTIIQLVEPGYVLHDRLLRPARVGVAKGEAGPAGDAHRVDETA